MRTHILGVGETIISGDFEWDSEKAASNIEKHEVSFEEAATVFASDLTSEGPDAKDPTRINTIGYSAQDRILLVVSTEVDVDDDRVRIISARRATKQERAAFEEG